MWINHRILKTDALGELKGFPVPFYDTFKFGICKRDIPFTRKSILRFKFQFLLLALHEDKIIFRIYLFFFFCLGDSIVLKLGVVDWPGRSGAGTEPNLKKIKKEKTRGDLATWLTWQDPVKNPVVTRWFMFFFYKNDIILIYI
jgi:hypothetical protein